MDMPNALAAFDALGQPSRLTVFRLLVQTGEAGLAAGGIDTSFARSKSWDEFATPDAPKMDFVFTVCDNAAAEECPYWPGQPMTAHWGLPDPAAATGTDAEKAVAFASTYASLARRIQAFCALPLATIDALSLKSHLKNIGENIQ